MIKYSTKKVIDESDWNKLVTETYGRPYNFQQQDGCKDRGTYNLHVSTNEVNEKCMNDSVPEKVNGEEMGVKFSVWLARDAKQPIKGEKEYNYMTDLWWDRNFYPCIEAVANDMCRKGLIEAGDYVIDIDW